MNVFSYNRSYRFLILAIFLLSLCAVAVVNTYGKGAMATVLFSVTTIFALMYFVHGWTSRVWVSGDTIFAKALFKTTAVKIDEIQDITSVKMKGRYLFFLMTESRFIMISSILERFSELKALLRARLPESVFETIEKVSNEEIAAANKRLNITLSVIFVLFAALILYISFVK